MVASFTRRVKPENHFLRFFLGNMWFRALSFQRIQPSIR